ncbi:MAG: hypothetical protein GQ574_27650 [Crocinitomix sp.]|nr:hypothetical protein [Crocinitomix sp.]
MKQVTVNIPDVKFDFIMKLFNELGINTIEIPQWQKDLVLKRIKESNENPDSLLDWDDVKDSF